METQPRRPIVIALMFSSVLHALTMGALVQWIPSRGPAGEAIASSVLAVSLTGQVAEPAGPRLEPLPLETESDPESATMPDRPAPLMPKQVAQDTVPTPWQPDEFFLDTAPVLQEEYKIDMASLAIKAPIGESQRALLATALNSWQEQLPDWYEQDEPLQ